MAVTRLLKSSAGERKPLSTGQPWQFLSPRRESRAIGRWVVAALAVLALVLLVAWASGSLPGLNSSEAVSIQTHVVTPGVLEIMVVEQGELESARNTEVKCEVEAGRIGGGGGRGGPGGTGSTGGSSSSGSSSSYGFSSGGGPGTQIIWIFPEGELARKGDKLVELDKSGLEEQELQEQILFETALQEKITAQNTYQAAKIAVDEYQYGTFENERELVEGEITVAEENLRRAQQYLQYSEQMYQKGYVNQLQLEADQFGVENAQLTLDAAKTKKKTLVEYTKPKMLKQLEGLRDSAKAAVNAAEAKFELEQTKLAKIRDQLVKCIIYAPQDGMVIYSNEQGRRRRTPEMMIEEGALVRFRQTIIKLPDLTQMQVKARVHESMIERVKPGQKVNISIDALPHLRLHGVVKNIKNQPEPSTSFYLTTIREYAVYISVDEQVENVKPGMTAEVEIQVDRLEDVLTLPVHAVVPKGEHFYCYVRTEGGVEERPVVLGDSNDVLVQIVDGLSNGEEVIVNPRAVVPEARQNLLPGESGQYARGTDA